MKSIGDLGSNLGHVYSEVNSILFSGTTRKHYSWDFLKIETSVICSQAAIDKKKKMLYKTIFTEWCISIFLKHVYAKTRQKVISGSLSFP